MNKKTRIRFAPSPTGYLHIGSLRTVLFTYLIAKSEGGTHILRIEDTDRSRFVEGAQESLIEVLNWIGIDFDEGPNMGGKFGPYVQSERKEIYDKYKQELLDKGEAYYCFCTPDRLQKMRENQQAKKLPPRYDRTCRDLSKQEIEERIKNGEKYVIRQKMPKSGEVVVNDELRGEIKFKAEELEDHVLIKSDGMPTYQFAVVIDDHSMEITHVLRGEEWIPSFPKNILLYKAFDWEAPKFIHMPLTLNKSGGKLSKRQGDVSVEDYKSKGYLVEALINFSVLSGWHPKDDNEILDIERLKKEFNYRDMGISPGVFDIEKLDYLNGYYIRQKDIDELTELCKPYLKENLKKTNDIEKQSDEYIKKVVAIEQERLKKLSDIAEITTFFFEDELNYDHEMLAWKKMTSEQAKENLDIIYELLEKIPEENWTNDSIEDSIVTYLKAKELKIGEYLWPMRVALTGKKASPSPFDVAEILGKGESLKRIRKVK
ncbi:glutamate--tRNA ligase [Candidatus Parcubacteria bacterium]|nr:glutamate--tRNA ligase [Candidatus Parcubacteria bacterium]